MTINTQRFGATSERRHLLRRDSISHFIPDKVLFEDLATLPGVGKGTLYCLSQLGIRTRFDLLSHLPSGMRTRREVATLEGVTEGELITVPATIVQIEGTASGPRASQGRRPLRIRCEDRAGHSLTILLFHAQKAYVSRTYPVGQERLFSGSLDFYHHQAHMTHPDFVGSLEAAPYWRGCEPVYPLTKGLTQKKLRQLMEMCLEKLPDVPEWLSPSRQHALGGLSWRAALQSVHTPQSDRDIALSSPPRQRLAFDELLANQVSLLLVRAHQKKCQGTAHSMDTSLREKFLTILPFKLTPDQERALADIDHDMASSGRMVRLLQGDVGSGKTVVAMMAMLTAVASGGQAALMAPTEVLARQHGETLQKWADALALPLEVLTGSDTASKKRHIYESLASGACSLVVGTHALIQEGLTFANLTLAVIDEQHRFGVEQRLKLTRKGASPDVLAMTATPIPRTLMLTAYGDLACSYLREKPAHCQPVETRVMSLERLEELVESLKKPLAEGAKIYWVCPLVEESEALDIAAAEERYESLKTYLPETPLGLIHGRLPAKEKRDQMGRFRRGDVRLLVATTVIEVGVDVQDATVMIIEQAERFGLAQLHQLRGRIGRGAKPGICLLLYGPETGEIGRTRLQVLKTSHDGFYIANQDWHLRGGGDALGARQSGAQSFRFTDLTAHHPLLEHAHQEAAHLLQEDPLLTTERGQKVRFLLRLFDKEHAMSYLEAT